MLEIPSTPWTARAPRDPKAAAPLAASWRRLSGKVEHTFSHFHLELAVLKSESIGADELRGGGDYRWVRREDLAAEALPTLMRKVVALALA
jgi:A/G-specific adenine glycosylase